MLTVAHNLSAMNAQSRYEIDFVNKSDAMEEISSGYNSNVSEEKAGLSVSDKMRRQVRGLTQGVEKVQEGVSLCQGMSGTLRRTNDLLHRVTELSIKAANETGNEAERNYIQREINQLLLEIDQIEDTTATNSFIKDTDKAKEMVGLSRRNILNQPGHSMMAQANQSNQGVLSLLQ